MKGGRFFVDVGTVFGGTQAEGSKGTQAPSARKDRPLACTGWLANSLPPHKDRHPTHGPQLTYLTLLLRIITSTLGLMKA